ncbi:MAG TPA: inositol monophosphatase family protein [Actinomycetales bacterium]|jgi:myo-inositol-1(or 4)-monophosphatase|nr:inositol monophosphatase family protein [Actinomycetales bacterium]
MSEQPAVTLPSNETLLTLGERAARAAGDLVRGGRREGLEVSATKTSPTDIVTQMDTAAESLLARTLLEERPDDGLLGEEGGLRPGTSGLTWVVDPIDGTVNYLYGIPAYAVSVAVVTGEPDPQTWTVLAGCVHNPETGETWTATRGGGARLNGLPVPGPAEVPMSRALVGTGFGYTVERRRRQAQVVATLLPRVRDIRRAGAASLDLCAVASGRLDAYYERGLKPWDLAAGGLVAEESGARVAGLGGLLAGEAMVIAAAPLLTGELGRLLTEAGALESD